MKQTQEKCRDEAASLSVPAAPAPPPPLQLPLFAAAIYAAGSRSQFKFNFSFSGAWHDKYAKMPPTQRLGKTGTAAASA